MDWLLGGLAFTQWVDTGIFAFVALNKAVASMAEFSSRSTQTSGQTGTVDAADDIKLSAADLDNLVSLDPSLLTERELAATACHQFDHAVQFLRHDLMRISGDAEAADAFLREHNTIEPLADTYAARLIASERWEDLIDFTNRVEQANANQSMVMFPEEVVPYEWETLREAALEALGRGDELVAMYRSRLEDNYDPNTELNQYKLDLWLNRTDNQ